MSGQPHEAEHQQEPASCPLGFLEKSFDGTPHPNDHESAYEETDSGQDGPHHAHMASGPARQPEDESLPLLPGSEVRVDGGVHRHPLKQILHQMDRSFGSALSR